MKDNRPNPIPPTADRMGRFIGQLRDHEGITQTQLARGLCAPSLLGRIENGEREVGKQLTDALFQRLGKPAELFERILDWGEFQQWTKRQEIISYLHHGEAEAALTGLQAYLPSKPKRLDRQFAALVEINCRALTGASAEELLPMVRDALRLTQPAFQNAPVQTLLLSQNEGRLLFAYLRLREQLDGFAAVAEKYNALLSYFKHPRYESRERVYLFPYVACRVIENEYSNGNYASALATCEDALEELTKEKRLFAYDQLLEWKQKLHDAVGSPDRTPEKLLVQLRLILSYAPKQAELLIPFDERGHVYCLNHVIRDRRKLLGISQETLAEGICTPRTLSRIEVKGGNLQHKNRKLLLQRVNMSGERYDYEVITDRYEDYLLRSDLGRAVTARDFDKASELLSDLHHLTSSSPTNSQYLLKTELDIRAFLPEEHPKKISLTDQELQLRNILNMTLPLDLENLSSHLTCMLSVNETLTLIALAFCYRKQGRFEKSLSLLSYIERCFKSTGTSVSFYEDLYTRIEIDIVNILGDIGQYQESNLLSYECLKISLGNNNTSLIPQYIYNIAWNMTQQYSECLREDTPTSQLVCTMLKCGYAAALISEDFAMLQYCSNRYFKAFGEVLNL